MWMAMGGRGRIGPRARRRACERVAPTNACPVRRIASARATPSVARSVPAPPCTTRALVGRAGRWVGQARARRARYPFGLLLLVLGDQMVHLARRRLDLRVRWFPSERARVFGGAVGVGCRGVWWGTVPGSSNRGSCERM